MVTTYDGSTGISTIYINGQLDKSEIEPSVTPVSSSNRFGIGRLRTSTLVDNMDANIAVVVMYNRILSATKVSANFYRYFPDGMSYVQLQPGSVRDVTRVFVVNATMQGTNTGSSSPVPAVVCLKIGTNNTYIAGFKPSASTCTRLVPFQVSVANGAVFAQSLAPCSICATDRDFTVNITEMNAGLSGATCTDPIAYTTTTTGHALVGVRLSSVPVYPFQPPIPVGCYNDDPTTRDLSLTTGFAQYNISTSVDPMWSG
eukprot:GDKI01031488.1.p1 GENE.GDKI01031488.1~~GDKI01031488.1.p1  ORF type:complete len:258 (-),score=26.13 GDKI01031488.1:710-1483(-)